MELNINVCFSTVISYGVIISVSSMILYCYLYCNPCNIFFVFFLAQSHSYKYQLNTKKKNYKRLNWAFFLQRSVTKTGVN